MAKPPFGTISKDQHQLYLENEESTRNENGATDLPFLMSYSGNAFDLFAEESFVLVNCLKHSVQYQPSPEGENEEAKAIRHSQMDAEAKASKKKVAAERKRRARSKMTQEKKHQDQAKGRARKKEERANMTQEEKHQDQAKGRARKKEERANMTQEERKQDLEDARTRRARNYASQVEGKAARQAAAGKKLREMLYAPNGHVSELPPPEDWPDITQCP